MKSTTVCFFPVLAFFIAYWVADIYVATAVIIAAVIVQIAIHWLRTRSFNKMHLVSAALLIVLGGLTLFLRDETFIQWKTTVVFWLFALVFLGSQFIGEKPLMQRMMGTAIELPPKNWRTLNMMWVVFWAAVGLINVYVIRNYSLDTWVKFKLFGVLGLTLLFVIGQGFWLAKHLPPEEKEQ